MMKLKIKLDNSHSHEDSGRVEGTHDVEDANDIGTVHTYTSEQNKIKCTMKVALEGWRR